MDNHEFQEESSRRWHSHQPQMQQRQPQLQQRPLIAEPNRLSGGLVAAHDVGECSYPDSVIEQPLQSTDKQWQQLSLLQLQRQYPLQ